MDIELYESHRGELWMVLDGRIYGDYGHYPDTRFSIEAPGLLREVEDGFPPPDRQDVALSECLHLATWSGGCEGGLTVRTGVLPGKSGKTYLSEPE